VHRFKTFHAILPYASALLPTPVVAVLGQRERGDGRDVP